MCFQPLKGTVQPTCPRRTNMVYSWNTSVLRKNRHQQVSKIWIIPPFATVRAPTCCTCLQAIAYTRRAPRWSLLARHPRQPPTPSAARVMPMPMPISMPPPLVHSDENHRHPQPQPQPRQRRAVGLGQTPATATPPRLTAAAWRSFPAPSVSPPISVSESEAAATGAAAAAGRAIVGKGGVVDALALARNGAAARPRRETLRHETPAVVRSNSERVGATGLCHPSRCLSAFTSPSKQ